MEYVIETIIPKPEAKIENAPFILHSHAAVLLFLLSNTAPIPIGNPKPNTNPVGIINTTARIHLTKRL